MASSGTDRIERLGRVFAEFSVIVLGVLVALSVDAWWGGVQERRTEQEMLVALASELEVAEGTLQDYVDLDTDIIRNADALLGTQGLSADSVAVLMSQLYHTIPRHAALPTVDEAMSTGRLRLFRDSDLRLAITEFMGRLRSLNEMRVQTEAQWNEAARPVLYSSTDFDRLPLSGNRHWGTTGMDEGPTVTAGPDTDAQLRNVIRDRRAFVSVRAMLIENRMEDLQELQAMVAEELGES